MLRAAGPRTFLPTVQGWLADDIRTAFVAEAEGTGAIGCVLAVVREHPRNPLTHPRVTVQLDQIAVHPCNRCQGVGAALVHQVLDQASRLGVDAMEPSVHACNDEAQAFFAAMGFRTVTLRTALRRDHRQR